MFDEEEQNEDIKNDTDIETPETSDEPEQNEVHNESSTEDSINNDEVKDYEESVTVQPVKFASFDRDETMSAEEAHNLDLLMDIELELTVELGRCELPIKKVLELTKGSIIELDKVAGEPVDLFANGKHIANGEVVVIGDNFGLRIIGITAPENRIKPI